MQLVVADHEQHQSAVVRQEAVGELRRRRDMFRDDMHDMMSGIRAGVLGEIDRCARPGHDCGQRTVDAQTIRNRLGAGGVAESGQTSRYPNAAIRSRRVLRHIKWQEPPARSGGDASAE